MANTAAEVKRAAAAYRAGQKEEARRILLDVVDRDEHNERAWLLLSALVDNLEEQQICLENVLALNPSNTQAIKAMEKIQAQLRKRAPSDSARDSQADAGFDQSFASFPAPDSGSRPEPFRGAFGQGGSSDANRLPGDSSSFADSPSDSFDSWLAANLDDSAPTSPPEQPSSSVDWSRDEGSSVYGSGRNVELPSPQEYDSWVESLQLDGPDAPQGSEDPPRQRGRRRSKQSEGQSVGPFSDLSFIVGDDKPAFSLDPAADPVGPFTEAPGDFSPGRGEPAPTPFDGLEASLDQPLPARQSPAIDDAGDGFPDDVAIYPAREGARAASEFVFDDDRRPAFDVNPEETDALAKAQAVGVTASSVLGGKSAAVVAQQSEYFAYIPDEIAPRSSGSGSRRVWLLVSVLGLLVLNILSIGLLLAAL